MLRVSAACLSIAGSACAAQAANYVEVLLTRCDNQVDSFSGFRGQVHVGLDAVLGAESIEIRDPSGGIYGVVHPGGVLTQGLLESSYATLAQMQQALNGSWEVSVNGVFDSVSTFTLDLSGIAATDLPPLATNLSPANGAIISATPSAFAWTAPTYILPKSQLHCAIDDEQHLLTPVSSTSWTPSFGLDHGVHEFTVGYLITEEAESISFGLGGFMPQPPPAIISVTSGTIDWTTSARGAAAGWGDDEVMVFRASEAAIAFEIRPVPEPMSLCLLLLGLALLSRRAQ